MHVLVRDDRLVCNAACDAVNMILNLPGSRFGGKLSAFTRHKGVRFLTLPAASGSEMAPKVNSMRPRSCTIAAAHKCWSMLSKYHDMS